LSQSTFEVGTVANRLFRVAADALSTVDSPQPVAPPKEVIDQLHKELVDASDYYALRVGRDAQGKYLAGLGAGTLVVAAAIVIVALAASGRAFVGLTTDGLLCGATGGALGAGLSVLTRITKGQMKIDHHSGTNQIVTFGAVRPFIGAILGVAAYAFTGAGLLSLQSPKAGGTLWLALGFAAGFSERLAQDMLTSPSLLSLKKTPGGAS
jgi:hypothetical protein